MKPTAALLAIALCLSAQAAQAQEPGEDALREGPGSPRGFERADRSDRQDRPDRPPAPQPAPEAPRAADAPRPDRFYGPAGRGGYERRDEARPRPDAGPDRDRSDRDRDGRDRTDRRDRDRDRDWDRDRRRWDDHRRDDRRYWAWGRWPGVYSSPYRYRYAWRPPTGFYARDWAFGEYLPRGWYGDGWWIDDPWAFRLPLPPPGFGWVRSGDDALLIDRYTGRVLQVVRDVFW